MANEHDDFRQAIEEGRARALLYWEKLAIAQAHGAPGNAGIVSLALRNRSRSASGWVDKTAVELTGAVSVTTTTDTLDVSDLTDEELDVLERVLIKTKAVEDAKSSQQQFASMRALPR